MKKEGKCILIIKNKLNMKYLQIIDKKGYFKRGEELIEIDQITTSDLHNLINHAHETDFEIDEYNQLELPNKAQQIIYENIFKKFSDFLLNKEQFNEQAKSVYAEAIGKYGANIESEPEPEIDDIDNLGQEDDDDDDEINPEDIPF